MKNKTILFLLILPLFISTGFLRRAGSTRASNVTSHEVEITFTGFTSLYGTPADCNLFKPDTVTLKGLLSGEEKVGSDESVLYTGILHLSIKMSICSAKRENG